MRILITGSRDWTDRDVIETAIEDVLRIASSPDGPVIVILGDCAGADRMASAIAIARGWHTVTVPANWVYHGRKAGFIRNAAMVSLMRPASEDICLAFINPCGSENCSALNRAHDSHGTADCVKSARAAGIAVREYRNG